MTEKEFNEQIKPLINKGGGYEEYERIKKLLLVNYGLFPSKVQEWILQKVCKELDL